MKSALLFLLRMTLFAGELWFDRVFRTRDSYRPACITAFSNEDLYLVYYGRAVDTGAFGARLKKGETKCRSRSYSRAIRFALAAMASAGCFRWSDTAAPGPHRGFRAKSRNRRVHAPGLRRDRADTESVGPDSTSSFLNLNAKTRQWEEHRIIRVCAKLRASLACPLSATPLIAIITAAPR